MSEWERVLTLTLLSFFFNSVFQPTKNIPPRPLGETGVRIHLGINSTFHYIIIIALHTTYLGDFPYQVKVRLYLGLYGDYILCICMYYIQHIREKVLLC